MKRVFIRLLMVVVAGVFLAAGQAFAAPGDGGKTPDKRVALIVGNANYAKITRLSNPVNDAPDLATSLRGLGFDVIQRTDIDMKGFDRALAEFERKAIGADTALFFFAGHGLQFRGTNYLLPIDADLQDEVSLGYEAMPVDKIRAALDRANDSGLKILILDACRNNPFTDRLNGLTRSTEATRGLAPINKTAGMIVAYATQANQVAQDGQGRNSPFTTALINRLQEPGLEIGTLFRRVAQDVASKTGSKQIPEVSISLLSDFYLNMAETDSMAWDRIRDSADANDFRRFIEKFPSSRYVRDAQLRIQVFQLMQQQSADLKAQSDADKRKKDEQDAEAKRVAEQKRRDEEEEAKRVKQAELEGLQRKQAEEKERAEAKLRKDQQEAEAKAAEQARIKQAEVEKRQRELEEQQRKATELAEKQRIEREQKALQEAQRKAQEAEAKRVADLCSREEGQLKQLSAAGKRSAIEDFRSSAACPTIGKAVDDAVKVVEAAEARLCDAERRDLATFKDLADLKRKTLAFKCLPLRPEAEAKVAALEAEEAKKAEICAAEARSVADLRTGGSDARPQLVSLRASLTCDAPRREADAGIKAVDALVKSAQTELKRLGCFTGQANGMLDDGTRASVSRYLTGTGSILSEANITSQFVDQMKARLVAVCRTEEPVVNEPPAVSVAPTTPVVRPPVKEAVKVDPAPTRIRPATKPKPVVAETSSAPVKAVAPPPAPTASAAPAAAPTKKFNAGGMSF